MLGEFSGNDRFTIVRRLGAGGMGTVYEALDRERNTRVALKTLRHVDPVGIYRFKVEFRSLTELSHPNLLPLYELFCEGEQWFFTMELLVGATDLRSFLGYGAHEAQDESSRPTVEFNSGRKPSAGTTPDSLETVAFTGSPDSSSGTGQTTLAAFQKTSWANETLAAVALDSGRFSSPANSEQPIAESNQTADVDLKLGYELGHELGHNLDYGRLRQAFLVIAQGVHALHAAGKLHRDLKPENVMVRADGQPVLLDFGLVLDLKSHVPAAGNEEGRQPSYEATTDHLVTGTLGYMAPEQATGSPLNESSDWYAFGVMLFEALTGRLPFGGSGIDMIRARLKQNAPPPSGLAPGTPPDLDRLCHALLSRDQASRPRSAAIFACLSGQAVSADEGRPVRSEFIGREFQLRSLQEAFTALESGQSGLVCVHGVSGMGKTALIEQFLAEAVNTHGAVLLAGRCYEQESVPYKAVDSLVDALTQLLMEMPEDQIAQLLPKRVSSLARVFPVLKRVEAIARAGSANASIDPLLVRQQAFQALGRLLAAVGERHKLVLFIDDLQWGDMDSAQLLAHVLAQQPTPRMLILFSYRSEYQNNACLREFRRAWESGRIPARELEVLPLNEQESRELAKQLLADTSVTTEQIDRIAEQARGSAFYVQELAGFVRTGAEWQTGTTDGGGAPQARDLDEVLWHRIEQLPAEARVLIEMIAVAGQPICFGDLLRTRSLAAFPQHAVKLLRTSRLARSTGTRLTDEIETFHDRVRESVIRFLDAPVSRDYHLQIADALEQNTEAAPETIATHLEAAQSSRASHYYELAGERAIQVLAFDRAEEFLKHAAKLAPKEADRVRVEVRLVHFYTDTARFQDAYDAGCDGTARLGFKLPRKFSPPLLLFNMAKGLMRKGRRKPPEFLELPVMTDERLMAVVQLISASAKAAYQVRPEICVTICTMAVNLCLKYGNTPDAAVDYMVFGCIFLGGILGRAQTGYEFGRLALALIDKFENRQQRAEVNFVVGYFGTSWLRPAVEAEALWQIAFDEGQNTGDLFHTGCAVAGTTQSLIMRGVPLAEVAARTDDYWQVVERAHLREPMTCLTSARRLIAYLRSTERELPATDQDMSTTEDEQLLAELAAFGSRHFAHFHFLNQCMLHALCGNISAGLNAAARSAAYLPDSKGLLNTPEHYFWSAMLHAMGETKDAAHDVTAARKRFAAWSDRCPANFSVRHGMLLAEEARLRGEHRNALDNYRQAATWAGELGNLHLEGLAWQRAARLASTLGRSGEAKEWEEASVRAYTEWGALALVPGFKGSPTRQLEAHLIPVEGDGR